jgi:hypothetical protein
MLYADWTMALEEPMISQPSRGVGTSMPAGSERYSHVRLFTSGTWPWTVEERASTDKTNRMDFI